MCVVSMIGDHYNDIWKISPPIPDWKYPFCAPIPEVSRAEFETLKKTVEEMKELLIKAKEYDARTNQPNCEMEEKVELLKNVAKAVGVDLSEIFKKGM